MKNFVIIFNDIFMSRKMLILLIVIVICCQLIVWPNFGTLDMNSFVILGETLDRLGLKNGYANYNLYYPPITSIIIYPFVKIFSYNSLSSYSKVLIIKSILALFYYLFYYLVYIFFT